MSSRRQLTLLAAKSKGTSRNNRPTGRLRAALTTTATASAVPYGYTLAIWSSGAIVMGDHGLPHVCDVFAFLAGGLIAYGLITWATADHSARTDERSGRQSDRLMVGALNWLAAGAAVGLVVFAAKLPGVAAWAVSSFAVTSVYLLGASVQLAAVERFRHRSGGGRTALTTSAETVP